MRARAHNAGAEPVAAWLDELPRELPGPLDHRQLRPVPLGELLATPATFRPELFRSPNGGTR